MNKLEFRKVMETMGIDNKVTTYVANKEEAAYIWNDLLMWCANGYTTVQGKIPLVVASSIYKKYPENQYGIRIEGSYWDEDPKECAHGDYISRYDIDTKEGLIVFLTEMEAYLNNEKITEERFEDLVVQVTTRALEEINPSINTYDWMQRCPDQKDMYNSTIEKDKKSELWGWFRNLVSEFDKAVNPYIDPDIELDDVSNYIKNVEINTYKSESSDWGECEFTIREIDGEYILTYMRHPEGFLFKLTSEALGVFHVCSEDGETITIQYYGSNRGNLKLDLTNKLAGEIFNEKKPVTVEQLGFIADELGKAIEIARNVSVKNMAKKGKEYIK